MFNKFANSFTKATGVQVPGATTAQQQQQQQHNQQQAPQYQQQYQQQQYPYQQQHQAPPQYNYQQQQQQCSHPAGPKRAVLIGINYRGQDGELNGCINDVQCMKFLLTTKFGYHEQAIVVLTEDSADQSNMRPTRQNMLRAMDWLIGPSGVTSAGDEIFFHYSGHGGQERDRTGTEADGMNETLCPVDYQTQGMITDDVLYATLVARTAPQSRLTAVIDACHSGTILDLPFTYNGATQQWQQHNNYNNNSHSQQGLVICFSGCDDDQTSADQSCLSAGVSTGAMTFSLIAAAEAQHMTTYAILFEDIYDTLKAGDNGSDSDSDSDSDDNNKRSTKSSDKIARGVSKFATKLFGKKQSKRLVHKFNKLKRQFLGSSSGNYNNNNGFGFGSAMQMYMNYTLSSSCSADNNNNSNNGKGLPYFSQEPQISSNYMLDLHAPFSL